MVPQPHQDQRFPRPERDKEEESYVRFYSFEIKNTFVVTRAFILQLTRARFHPPNMARAVSHSLTIARGINLKNLFNFS